MMDMPDHRLEEYILAHTEPESALLHRIYRETHLEMPYPRMICGHLQGRLLSSISRMIRPKRILEIGTFTGYSAICLSEGLQQGGTIESIDKNEELKERVLAYWKEAGLENACRLHIGDALEFLEQMTETYDLVFLDADKENYPKYIEPIVRLTRKGSWVLADNVLWSGKVIDGKDPETTGIQVFNEKIQLDPRFRNLLLPVRDGLMIMERL